MLGPPSRGRRACPWDTAVPPGAGPSIPGSGALPAAKAADRWPGRPPEQQERGSTRPSWWRCRGSCARVMTGQDSGTPQPGHPAPLQVRAGGAGVSRFFWLQPAWCLAERVHAAHMLTLCLKDCWAGPEPLGSLSSRVGPKWGVCGSCDGGRVRRACPHLRGRRGPQAHREVTSPVGHVLPLRAPFTSTWRGRRITQEVFRMFSPDKCFCFLVQSCPFPDERHPW